MFRSLLTPLRTAFDDQYSPRNVVAFPVNAAEPPPEDFARDVRVEIVRRTLDELKTAANAASQTESLAQILIVLREDASLKDVFSELDGFIVVVSVLSGVGEAETDVAVTMQQEALRLCFAVLSEAMFLCPGNQLLFEQTVGYGTLGQALVPIAKRQANAVFIMGLLLSLALGDLTLGHFFMSAPDSPNDSIDTASLDSYIQSLESKLLRLAYPQAIIVLLDISTNAPHSAHVFYAVSKTIERTVAVSPRNQASLNELGLAISIFKLLYDPPLQTLVIPDVARPVLQKALRRLLEMGSSVEHAKYLFRSALTESKIDSEVLAALRYGSRAKWPEFFSLHEKAALSISDVRGKVFPPPSGFSFLSWIYIERMPTADEPLLIFGARSSSPSRWLTKLSLNSSGALEFITPSMNDSLISPTNSIRRGRWTHVAIVHHAVKASAPLIRLYIDGNEVIGHNAVYPKPSPPPTTFHIGCDSSFFDSPRCRWALASCHLIACSLHPDLLRIIHHLGPRYGGNFQDGSLIRFLTYEATTSLNIHLFGLGSSNASTSSSGTLRPGAMLSNALRGSVGFTEDQVIFSLSPRGVVNDPRQIGLSGIKVVSNAVPQKSESSYAVMLGDVRVAYLQCLDVCLWRIGGPAVALRLVQASVSPSDLLNALGVLFDAVRTSWQNSEDMERIQGYDVLASLLRTKSQILTEDSFCLIFEFLGLDFKAPLTSTIVNTAAYRSIALDFHLWSLTSKSIQRLYWDHFAILLETSNFRRFNSKQRFAKKFGTPGISRQALFILQTDLYSEDILPSIVDAIRVISKHTWSADTTIKPIISYLASSLHSIEKSSLSPQPPISTATTHINIVHLHEKAEMILEALYSILRSDTHLAKYSTALPGPRIALLLLGTHPSPTVAATILRIVTLQLSAFSNFSRKLDLVNFWAILKVVLPSSWNSDVHLAVFDLLMGQVGPSNESSPVVRNPQIMPVIFASLEHGANKILQDSSTLGQGLLAVNASPAGTSGSAMDALLEGMIELYSTSPTFRIAFKSRSNSSSFIELAKSYALSKAASDLEYLNTTSARLMDKMLHLALMLKLEDGLDHSVQRERIKIKPSKLESLIQIAEHPPLSSSSGTTQSYKRRSFLSFSGLRSAKPDDKAVQKALSRISTWRSNIIATEKKRRRKMTQDLRENLRALQRLSQWQSVVHHERGLWPRQLEMKWRLDEAEGPYRIRKKLEPELDYTAGGGADSDAVERTIIIDTDEHGSISQVTAPWDEGYEFSIAEDERDWNIELTEDKHRRIRHELEPGDVIEAVQNVARIVGADSSPGLFIYGHTHLYLRDGLVVSSDGDIVDVREAPKDVLIVPGTLIVSSDPNPRARRWHLDAIRAFSTRTYLFRDVSLEIYFKDSRSLLCVFASKADRQNILNLLQRTISKVATEPGVPQNVLKAPSHGRYPSASMSSFNRPEVEAAQKRWQAREISNFAYLSVINQASGRTPNDLTQYPVFPWILKNYTSAELDLTSADTYRNLGLPMGALTEARQSLAEARYSALADIGEPPFHYGTHFSSSMITSHFLIRMSPFSRHFKALQGGDFDLPERLFVDIQRAWESASQDNRGDVRELIPEFFTCPEFLDNLSNLELGVNAGGQKIGSVNLPRWAKEDPILFIAIHRQALESDFVSRHIPSWIDLIWGCKQRDISSFNVFHPLSYEGAIDLDSIEDPLERAASVGIIHNFGQTPRKIFSSPHPPRFMDGIITLPVGTAHGVPEHPHLISQSPRPLRTQRDSVSSLCLDFVHDKVVPCAENTLIMPFHPNENVEWGFHDQSLRIFVDRKTVQVVEAIPITCAVCCDSDILVTGGSDNLVTVWRFSRGVSGTKLNCAHVMRGHDQAVLCVTASRPWSLIVSGSEDGTAIFWDLNRAQYVRSIRHDRPIHTCTIHATTGDVALCSVDKLSLYTVNGQHITSVRLQVQERITSLAFHERETALAGIIAAGSTDGSIVLRTWNADDTPSGQKAKWKFVTVRHLKLRSEQSSTVCVTALKFVGETLYSGDDTGRVFSWSLPGQH